MSTPFDLTPSLYHELEQRARAILGMRRVGDDPETLSLVHQACLKMLKGDERTFSTRAEFLAFSAKAMRHVLIDLVRSRKADRRGGGRARVPLDDASESAGAERTGDDEILDVHEKLERLAAEDERLARIVELRFFGGLTFPEIAEVIGASREVAEADWRFAKVWLRGALDGE
ncbi:MAG: ECF-type sigma factor [Planctomycetota bacterium JB042]